jgi:hypothetical protein
MPSTCLPESDSPFLLDHLFEDGTRSFLLLGSQVILAIVDEDITMSTTTPAAPQHQAPLPSLAGPITRARARDLNFVIVLKNEGPEE